VVFPNLSYIIILFCDFSVVSNLSFSILTSGIKARVFIQSKVWAFLLKDVLCRYWEVHVQDQFILFSPIPDILIKWGDCWVKWPKILFMPFRLLVAVSWKLMALFMGYYSGFFKSINSIYLCIIIIPCVSLYVDYLWFNIWSLLYWGSFNSGTL